MRERKERHRMRSWRSTARLFTAQLLAGLALLVSAHLAHAQSTGAPTVEEAKQFFATLVSLGDNYDPRYAELFSDLAYIQNTRRYPGGKARVTKLNGVQYQEMILRAIPIAKSVRDRSSYSKVSYSAEGNGVRIHATRFAERKNYYSPIAFLVVREGGQLKIIEEISESQP
jgi:hypothetical protein